MSPQSLQPDQSPPPQQSTADLVAQQVIAKYSAQLKTLVDTNCRQAVDREKVYQYAVCRRNDFYYRGQQHLAPTFSGAGNEAVDFKPVNGAMRMASGNANQSGSTAYDYVINNFRGDIRKFVGVLGQKSPNVRALPTWASDQSSSRLTTIANDCAGYLKSQWDADRANRQLALSLAKNGTTFIYTPFVSNAARYGTHKEPVWGTQTQKIEPDGYRCVNCGQITQAPQAPDPPPCATCGQPLGPEDWREGQTEDVPAITGEKEYPNGTVELHIHSPYDVTTPFFVKDLEHCPWLWLEHEDDAASLASEFPEKGLEAMLSSGQESTGSSGSASSIGKIARDQASSPTGYSVSQRPNRWLKSQFWLTPAMYLYLLKGATNDNAAATVEELKSTFPRGLKLTWVQDKLVNVEHERLDEVWSAVKPETSEYLYADPIFNDYIQIADLSNDFWNINAQLAETMIPATIFDPNVLDRRKIQNGFQPNEFIPCIPGAGSQLSNAFFKVPTSDWKPELLNFQKSLIETAREIVGLLPAIWGGDDNVQTAEQARRRLNQALMILATTWNEMRMGWAKAYRNGILQLSRYSLGRLVDSLGDPQTVTVKEIGDLNSLLKGGWYMECDQAMPMTWTQLRDFVWSLITMPPEAAHMLGVDDPDNLDRMNDGIGIPGWKIPKFDERNRIRDLIGKLMQAAPVPGPNGPAPSTPLDFQVEWNPQMVITVMHEWLMSEDGRSAEGSPGYENVKAAGLSALAAMAPPPMAPPPGGGGGGKPQQPPPADGAQPLPGPLQPTNPTEAPQAPLMPLNGPGGGMQFNPQPMVQ